MSTSANYLLNFTYERPASYENTSHKKRSSRSRAYNKEHFLRANFRFVISPYAPPAHPAIYEADTLIDWDFVDTVCLSKPAGTQQSTCPICLEALRVPKITRCGHIFCTTCILRHLHPYETHRCPMCFDTVYRTDLRPVEIRAITQPEINNRLEFVLLSRVKGTLNPKKVEDGAAESTPEDDDVLSLSQLMPLVGTEDAGFARLVLGSRDMQASCFEEEREALREIAKELVSEGEEGYLVVVEEALRDLDERMRKAAAAAAVSGACGERQSPVGGRRARPRGESGGEEMLQFTPDGAGDGEREAKAVLAPPSDVSHFFQLSDGQYVFLHPFNMRCLMAEAEGSYSRLPPRVEGKVLDIETLTLTPEVRSRWPFLKHLPLYSVVKLVEMDIKLSDAVYARFKGEIQKRKQKRKNRQRAEGRQKGGKPGEEQKGGGIGVYSEEALQEMRARREHVDLTGPLPWEASLMGEEKDFKYSSSPVLDKSGGGSSPVSPPDHADHLSSDSVWGGRGKKGGGSFAEITRMNGHFPALGGRGLSSASTTPHSLASSGRGSLDSSDVPTPTGTSPPMLGMSPPSIWASRNPLLSSSPPQFAGGQSPMSSGVAAAWVRQTTPVADGKSNVLHVNSCEPPLQQSPPSSEAASSALLDGGSAKKKKSKSKGIPLFSTASLRKY